MVFLIHHQWYLLCLEVVELVLMEVQLINSSEKVLLNKAMMEVLVKVMAGLAEAEAELVAKVAMLLDQLHLQ